MKSNLSWDRMKYAESLNLIEICEIIYKIGIFLNRRTFIVKVDPVFNQLYLTIYETKLISNIY